MDVMRILLGTKNSLTPIQTASIFRHLISHSAYPLFLG